MVGSCVKWTFMKEKASKRGLLIDLLKIMKNYYIHFHLIDKEEQKGGLKLLIDKREPENEGKLGRSNEKLKEEG